uniref:NADH-ubiquinone oxidoreductase chain 3 n=1 Tax=Ovatella vulcani TaxID=999270 RepID=G8HPA5_9EUPU|nr:NADH dehydrogenase subunit 3 [Ovatella vulcani]AEQ93850.1 NADH dehydrogenase subunit 3 [Ovatella vulcani]
MLSPLIIFSFVLTLALLVIYYLTSFPKEVDGGEKMTAFECGFEPLSQMRSPFSARFFILVVLFLIFDVEVALLFPVLTMISTLKAPVVGWAFLAFLAVLLIGLFHEWDEGAIDWVSV